ncbi:uncharacterized protein LOC128269751 [Anopheles cruzii]|uniref:uncharacterized protein LOC128269751 n=1 Tax=Anopheles cruzii TaxID=68878 RepID=UPI0022EC231B|nr:uncharacterized protein LOC128269751 [Anopheles cruzii]
MSEQQEERAKEDGVVSDANQPAHRDPEEEQKAEAVVVDVKADSPAVEPRDSVDEPAAPVPAPPDDKVAEEEQSDRVASPASPSAASPPQSPTHERDACEPKVESKEPDGVGGHAEEPTTTVAAPGERSRSTSPATDEGGKVEGATTEEEEERVAAAKQDLSEEQTAAAAVETGEAVAVAAVAAAVAMEADDMVHRVPQAGDDADRHGNNSDQDGPSSSSVMEVSPGLENVSPRPTAAPVVAPVEEATAETEDCLAVPSKPKPKPVAVPLPKDDKKTAAAGALLVSKIPLDTGRLEADLQYAKRQLADVRSKYDVTRKELHATKRKLKRITARMNGPGGGGSGTSGSGPGSGGNSPQGGTGGGAPVGSSSDDDRNRKWREPMILSAMKIKAAMGIQAYKSLIKDGELLLPSLRTITRYLESLRKASSSGGGPGEQLVGGAGGAPMAAAIGSCAMVVDDDDGDDDDEEDDGGRRDDRQVAKQQLVRGAGPIGHKGAKAGVNGSRRVVDHNRNEQRQRTVADPALESDGLYHRPLHYPDVQQEVDQMSRQIKTEHDPVSFTASPDINYYQHNADDDEDDDEDGCQNPASLLQDYGGATTGDHYNQQHPSNQQQQQQQQQQTLSQTQIEFLKSMVGFRKKWTPYELRMCNDVRRIIGSREYDSLRKNDGMPLPSVKTLRKYRHAAPLEDVDAIGRKRKLHEALDDSSCQPQIATPYGGGGAGDDGGLFSYGRSAKRRLKAEHDPDGQFDARMLTLAQIKFLQTLSLNTKGFSDYELQRSLELKNELGCKNYELLRQQEFLNIPTLAMLTRYEQDNGLEDLSRYAEAAAEEDEERHDEADGGGGVGGDGGGGGGPLRLVVDRRQVQDHRQQQQQQQEVDEQQAREQQQQLELYNRLTQADPARHPLFDSIADDSPPGEGAGGGGGDHPGNVTAAAIAAAMVAAAAGLNPLDLNGGSGGGTGDDSSLSIFEHHSIFDKDTPSFDMTKLSPAHVEFLNTLPENPKRWTQEMINSALDIKNEIGTRDYEILRRQGIPLPAARTLRRHKDIRSKADRVGGEPGELLPPRSGGTTPAPAGIVGSG